ncbi:unnamed protein product [Blepharisma stoltei]|uniref:Uncharacterized protein n=1 Tax=Blepharisma stoltei TaxID=1481888 RepID=A0AAU9JJJ7_9CILI|nr:unnamed protein product [Blepharisma stoltei]
MSLIRFIARGFAYKPIQKPIFVNGKCKLYESIEGNGPHYATSIWAALTAYVTRSVILNHSSFGWLHLIGDMIAISLGSFEVFRRTTYTRHTVKELSLLENGKDLEVITQGAFFVSQKKIVSIKSIIDPEFDKMNQFWIKTFEAWIMITKNKEKFMIYPTGNIIHKEILSQVIIANEIIVSGHDDSKIIDV